MSLACPIPINIFSEKGITAKIIIAAKRARYILCHNCKTYISVFFFAIILRIYINNGKQKRYSKVEFEIPAGIEAAYEI
jgi:hypothetical protein